MYSSNKEQHIIEEHSGACDPIMNTDTSSNVSPTSSHSPTATIEMDEQGHIPDLTGLA